MNGPERASLRMRPHQVTMLLHNLVSFLEATIMICKLE